jgi:hypothetical protein
MAEEVGLVKLDLQGTISIAMALAGWHAMSTAAIAV